MRIARRITLGLMTITLLAMAVVTLTAWHQGYRLYVVHTGSMTPALKPGDVVFDKPARGDAIIDRPSTAAVKPGEIVTFVSDPHGTLVTHRVVAVKNGVITTKGDANLTNDPWTLNASQVVGQRITTLPRMGYVLMYLKQPLGIASILLSVIGLMLLWRLFFPVTQANHRLAAA